MGSVQPGGGFLTTLAPQSWTSGFWPPSLWHSVIEAQSDQDRWKELGRRLTSLRAGHPPSRHLAKSATAVFTSSAYEFSYGQLSFLLLQINTSFLHLSSSFSSSQSQVNHYLLHAVFPEMFDDHQQTSMEHPHGPCSVLGDSVAGGPLL